MTDGADRPTEGAADPGDDVLEEFFWGPLREALGLGPEAWKNFTRVLALHLVLDRLLTLTITTRLCAGAGAEGQVVEPITNAVAELSFRQRIEVTTKAGWVAADVADDLREVNRVRNKLLHFDPQRNRFEGVPEIASAAAFRQFTLRGQHAYTKLAGQLLPLFEKATEDEP